MTALTLVADLVLPLALAIRARVLGPLIWTRAQEVLKEITCARAKAPTTSWSSAPSARIIIAAVKDQDGRMVDVEAKVADPFRATRRDSGRSLLQVDASDREDRFLDTFSTRIEAHWVDAALDLRARRVGRELSHLGDGELEDARDFLNRWQPFLEGPSPCRYSWILAEMVRREILAREEQPLSGHERMQHTHACRSLREEVLRELGIAKAAHGSGELRGKPGRFDVDLDLEGDVRLLAEYRAERARARREQAIALAREVLESGPETRPPRPLKAHGRSEPWHGSQRRIGRADG